MSTGQRIRHERRTLAAVRPRASSSVNLRMISTASVCAVCALYRRERSVAEIERLSSLQRQAAENSDHPWNISEFAER
jgi:hypothetical protein